jgi:uncharacterized Zn finger protein
MPSNIEEAFAAANANLFPAQRGDLVTDCSCPDYANPCKHVSAVYYLLSEQFEADPFLLFQLRGRSRDQVTAALRALRAAGHAAGSEHAEAEPAEGQAEHEQAAPLASLVDAFWSAPEAAGGPIPIPADAARTQAAPVRRLGEPPFWSGKPAFGDRASRAYAAIARAALEIALGRSAE